MKSFKSNPLYILHTTRRVAGGKGSLLPRAQGRTRATASAVRLCFSPARSSYVSCLRLRLPPSATMPKQFVKLNVRFETHSKGLERARELTASGEGRARGPRLEVSRARQTPSRAASWLLADEQGGSAHALPIISRCCELFSSLVARFHARTILSLP